MNRTNTKSYHSRKISSNVRDFKLILKRHTRYLGELTQVANTQIDAKKKKKTTHYRSLKKKKKILWTSKEKTKSLIQGRK